MLLGDSRISPTDTLPSAIDSGISLLQLIYGPHNKFRVKEYLPTYIERQFPRHLNFHSLGLAHSWCNT